jgi:membrane fusion protein
MAPDSASLQGARVATEHSVSPLFRREAIEFQQHQRQWGDVALLQPVSTKLLTWSLAASVALIIVFLMFAEYARKETANGYLTPSAGTAKVFAPREGVIEAVYVKEGQQVTQGQPLLRVATDQLSGGGEDVNAVTFGLLTSHRDLLSGQIAAEEQRMSSEQQRLNASLDNLKNEASLLHNQMTMQVQRVKSGETLVSMASALVAKGLVSEVDRVHREQAVLDDTERLSSMAQQATSLQDRTSQTRYELEQLATVTATKLQPLRSELSSTEQRIAEIGARRAYAVRAPISGRVSLLQVNVGQPTDPHRLEMEIVSANANLEAVLFVPARAAGFVHEGQRVRLLYDAFPYQKYGTHSGRIIGVSQTILTGADVSGPIALKEPAYRAIVALDEAVITTRDKKTIPLQPDMLLRADIILERRTIMSWILEPLRGARI